MSRHSCFVLLALLLALALFAWSAAAKSCTGNRVLVLLDDTNKDKDLYSKFWQALQDRDFSLDFKAASASKLSLEMNGERLYDHIILFSHKTRNFGSSDITPQTLVEFVKSGGNILLGGSPTLSDSLRDFAREFSVDFDDRDTVVIDHFSYNATSTSDTPDHTLIVLDTPSLTKVKAVVSSLEAPVLYRGIGHKAGSTPLLTKILSAGFSAYSAENNEEQPADAESTTLVGTGVGLVSALQARNSARVTITGSLELFEDKFFDSPVQVYTASGSAKKFAKSGNEKFVAELTKWTFQEKGVLKVVSSQHIKDGEKEQLKMYRIKDNITYTIEISEYVNDAWIPFKASDVQLELVMLDPYIRRTLTPLPSASNQRAAKFQTHLQLPDVYGVFTFRVNYKRPGYTYLLDQSTVALRPFRHDEYPRFLTAAYPYYAGAASMSAGFLVFVVVWLSAWGTEKTMKVDKVVKSEKQDKSEKIERIKEEKPDDRAATPTPSETGSEKGEKTEKKKKRRNG